MNLFMGNVNIKELGKSFKRFLNKIFSYPRLKSWATVICIQVFILFNFRNRRHSSLKDSFL